MSLGRRSRQTTAELIVDRLREWGVDRVFGLPGDGINGFMEALRTRRDSIRFIQVRHEESAAFMACAHAKYTGRLGVCLATTGPGAIHLLNGLYDAKLDSAPVLAITGSTYHDLVGMNYQQDVNLPNLFADVAVYNHLVMGAAHAESVVDAACRTALSRRGVAHISCPIDFQEQELREDEQSSKMVEGHTSTAWLPPVAVPCAEDIERAARVLNEGRKVVILAGQGAADAGEELLRCAEALDAPVVKALLGKAVIPDDSPYALGGIGLLGTEPSERALEDCDTLFMVGTNFPYLEYYPKPGTARGVQIDRDPARIGLRYAVEVGLAGDAKSTLQALLPMLEGAGSSKFLAEGRARMREWRELIRDRGSREDVPMKPQVLAARLGEVLADDAIISTDSGTVTAWAARHISIRGTQKFSCSGTLASMACAVPYSIAAQLAYPERQCVAFVGDGGFSMLMSELVTAVKYALPITVVVLNNGSLGMIKWEQMVFLGNPEYGCELQPIDFVKVAEACGAAAVRCEAPGEIRDVLAGALARAREERRPVLVDAVVDPYEPPQPPRVKREQAVHMAKALARGEPNGSRIALTLFRDKVHDLF